MIDMNLITSDEVFLIFLFKKYNLITFYYFYLHQIKLINTYHERVQKTIGDLLQEQGHLDAYDWLVQQTIPIAVTNKFL